MDNPWLIAPFPFVITTSTALAAYNVRNLDSKYRWVMGMIGMQSVSYWSRHYFLPKWKQVLPTFLTNDNPNISAWWLWINIGISMWMCNVFCGFFGGNKYYKKRGIDNINKVLINSLCIGQCYFHPLHNAHDIYETESNHTHSKCEREKSMMKLFKLCSAFGFGYGISKYLENNPSIKQYIDSKDLIKFPVMGLLTSLAVLIPNIPSIIHGIIFGGGNNKKYKLEVIEPYDFVLFNKSIRVFWKNWSRPAGELFRYMIYEPLGGRNNISLSVSAIFVMNCTIHYDLSFSLYGDRATKPWNKAFALMGSSLIANMLAENYLIDMKQTSMKDYLWKAFNRVLFVVSMLFTLKIIHKKALIVNTSSLCNTFLMKPVFAE